jgi:hypothetical protein
VQASFVSNDDSDVRVSRGPRVGTDDELVADLVALDTAGGRDRAVEHIARGDATHDPRDAAYDKIDQRGDRQRERQLCHGGSADSCQQVDWQFSLQRPEGEDRQHR